MQTGEAAHHCSTCGFNQKGLHNLFNNPNRTNVCTWFSKSWDEEDKQLKIARMGQKSSKISIFFQGDERANHSETLLDSTLKLLGNGWFIHAKGFKCQLVGGGTTFSGAVYARTELKQDPYVMKKKVLAHYKKEHSRVRLPFCNAPEFEDSTLLRVFSRFPLKSVRLIQRAMQFEYSKSDAWTFRHVPDNGTISKHVAQLANASGSSKVDVCIDYCKKHSASFRESFRYKEEGVATNDSGGYDMVQIKSDFECLYNGVDERDRIYNYDLFH